MDSNEIWVSIKGYENYYQISNFGRVKSLGRDVIIRGIHKVSRPKILALTPIDKKDGYLGVLLYKNGSRKRYKIHQLVAQHFIPNPDNKPLIDHINGIKTDNKFTNLRWVDYFENSCGNPSTPTTPNRPILQYDLKGNFIKEYRSAIQASKELNINQANIVHCLKGKYKYSGGYIWKYKQ